jgi:hypothetical protein
MTDAQRRYQIVQEFLSQPGTTFEVTKIHPYDMAEKLDTTPPIEILPFYDGCGIMLAEGKAYFITTAIPAVTKKFQ